MEALPASIATIAQYLAGKMGFAFENNGVSGNLSTPYYPGTYMDQFQQLSKHANFDFYFDGNATLAICPKGQPRQGKAVPVFTPQSGLIGFPTIGRFGPNVDVLFTPALTLGGKYYDCRESGPRDEWDMVAVFDHARPRKPDARRTSAICPPSLHYS